MLMAQLGIDAAEALVRLRAHAYATDRSAIEVARDILDRRLMLEDGLMWSFLSGQPVGTSRRTIREGAEDD